jgi:hypothetical protein
VAAMLRYELGVLVLHRVLLWRVGAEVEGRAG